MPSKVKDCQTAANLLKFCTAFFAAGLQELDEAIKSPFAIVIDDL